MRRITWPRARPSVHSRTLMLRRALTASLVLAAFAACSAAPSLDEIRSSREKIIKGTDSPADQDAVILLVSTDGGFGSCSGTLIAPNLVLTARHCVSRTADVAFACDIKGNLVNFSGQQIGADHPASRLLVFTGTKRPSFFGGTPTIAAKGVKIFHDTSTTLCSHDLSLVLLDKDIPNAKIAPIRLDGPPVEGETFTAVGWGVTDTTSSPDVRQQRAGIKVLKVGPANYPGEPVPPNDFLVAESICSGDSGGPALATDTNAVIGVVSRGGNGKAPDPNDPAAECLGAMNFYSSTAAQKDLILQAFTEAGHEPWIEGGPDPRLAKTGEPCTQDADCRSNACITVDGSSFCTADCSADPSVCPTGYDCKANNGAQQCVPHKDAPPPPQTTKVSVGCALSPSSSGSNALAILGALGAAIVTLRRSRRVTRR